MNSIRNLIRKNNRNLKLDRNDGMLVISIKGDQNKYENPAYQEYKKKESVRYGCYIN